MRVLLTGASGFVGSHAARALLADGHDVMAMVRPGNPRVRLNDVAERLTLLVGDLAIPPSYECALDWRPEACLHLAWYAKPGMYLEAPENIPALNASIALLERLIAAGCQRVVMAGTCAEYDCERGWLREDAPTRPTTLYAASKLALCELGQQLARIAGIKFTWARLFHLYGPHEDPRRVIPALLRALLAGKEFPASRGEQIRDFLHVADVGTALATLISKPTDGIYNIASGEPVSMRHIMEMAGDLIGKSHLIRFGEQPTRAWEPRFLCGDNARLRALGWAPHFNLSSGLEQTLGWWREYGSQVQRA